VGMAGATGAVKVLNAKGVAAVAKVKVRIRRSRVRVPMCACVRLSVVRASMSACASACMCKCMCVCVCVCVCVSDARSALIAHSTGYRAVLGGPGANGGGRGCCRRRRRRRRHAGAGHQACVCAECEGVALKDMHSYSLRRPPLLLQSVACKRATTQAPLRLRRSRACALVFPLSSYGPR
jgi:hypothetical protein